MVSLAAIEEATSDLVELPNLVCELLGMTLTWRLDPERFKKGRGLIDEFNLMIRNTCLVVPSASGR